MKMILNEYEILRRLAEQDPKKRLVIKPIINKEQFGPGSFDIRLGTDFKLHKSSKFSHINALLPKEKLKPRVREITEEIHIHPPPECFFLHPREFVLACSLEFIRLPNDLAGKLHGRSSLGRLGLSIHSTAGYIDPGFSGNITFELINESRVPIPLYSGLRIAQIVFYELKYPSQKPYGGKYQGSIGTASSKFFEDSEFEVIKNMSKDIKIEEFQEFLENFEKTEKRKIIQRLLQMDK